VRAVILDQDPLDEILSWNDQVLVGILIWPRFFDGPEAFDALLKELRKREEAHRGKSPFATALFHPRLKYSEASPDQLIPLFRRSPDPSVQFIRHAALDAVRSAAPSGKFVFDFSARAWAELERREKELPVSDRIARDNAAHADVARILAIQDELRADRDASYARLGER
jgi:hypothetical protein